MNHTTIVVKGMSCESCVRSVKTGLGRMPGVRSVEVELASGKVRLDHEGDGLGEAKLRAAVDDLGYDFGGLA
jgi:copper chaperone CopZ